MCPANARSKSRISRPPSFALSFFLALACLRPLWPETAEPQLKLPVRTYNYADVPSHILLNAEQHAAEIFRRADIDLAWIDCPVSRSEIEKFPVCTRLTGDARALTLKILPESMAAGYSLPITNLGVTYLAPIRPFAPCRMRAVIVSFAVWGFSLQAAPVPETAVFSAFRQVDAGLSHFVQLQRTGVTGELDLVIAMGSAKAFPAETPWIFWTEDRKTAFSCRRKTAPRASICWEQNSDSRTAPRVSNVSPQTIPSSPVMARNPSSSPIRS